MNEIIYWRKLTPQERDALVATIVFKRKAYKDNPWGQWLLFHETKPGITEAIPRYSEMMDAAVEVMKHFEVPVILTYSKDTFMCKITPVDGEPCFGLSRNPAEAVCRAALQACGFDISLA